MSVFPQTLENLASMGVNIELTEKGYFPQTLENLVAIVRANGGHILINVSGAFPATLERLAQIGGNHITFRF